MLANPFLWCEDDKFFPDFVKTLYFRYFEAESIRRKIHCCIRLKYKIVFCLGYKFQVIGTETGNFKFDTKKKMEVIKMLNDIRRGTSNLSTFNGRRALLHRYRI
jgi:hypothetical protein